MSHLKFKKLFSFFVALFLGFFWIGIYFTSVSEVLLTTTTSTSNIENYCRPRDQEDSNVFLQDDLSQASAASQNERIDLRLMQTTDIHAYLRAWDYYQDKVDDDTGLSKISTLVKVARTEKPNNLLFDNGDLIQGNPLGDYINANANWETTGCHPIYQVMNYMEYDAANLGNHEFNYGVEYLEKAIKYGPKFPYLSSNIYRVKAGNKLVWKSD